MMHRGRDDNSIGRIAMLPIQPDTGQPGSNIDRLDIQSIEPA